VRPFVGARTSRGLSECWGCSGVDFNESIASMPEATRENVAGDFSVIATLTLRRLDPFHALDRGKILSGFQGIFERVKVAQWN